MCPPPDLSNFWQKKQCDKYSLARLDWALKGKRSTGTCSAVLIARTTLEIGTGALADFTLKNKRLIKTCTRTHEAAHKVPSLGATGGLLCKAGETPRSPRTSKKRSSLFFEFPQLYFFRCSHDLGSQFQNGNTGM